MSRYLDCPFDEKDEAKALGAKARASPLPLPLLLPPRYVWHLPPSLTPIPLPIISQFDWDVKKWFVPDGVPAGRFARWLPASRSGGGGGGGGARQRGDGKNTGCFKCGVPGHWAKDCPNGGNGNSGSNSGSGLILGREYIT